MVTLLQFSGVKDMFCLTGRIFGSVSIVVAFMAVFEVSWQQYSSTVLSGAKALKVTSDLKVYKMFLKELISQGW